MALPPGLSKKVKDRVVANKSNSNRSTGSNPRNKRNTNTFKNSSPKKSSGIKLPAGLKLNTKKPTKGTLSFNSNKITAKPFKTPQFNSIAGFTSFTPNPSFLGNSSGLNSVRKGSNFSKKGIQNARNVRNSDTFKSAPQNLPQKPTSNKSKSSPNNNNPFPTIESFVDFVTKNKSPPTKKPNNVFFDKNPKGFINEGLGARDANSPIIISPTINGFNPQPENPIQPSPTSGDGGGLGASISNFFDSLFGATNPVDTSSNFSTEPSGLPAPQFDGDLGSVISGGAGDSGDLQDQTSSSFIDSIINDPVKLGLGVIGLVIIISLLGGKRR